MWERILQIVKKEVRQTLRDPRMRGIILVPPLMQTIIFGFAVNLDVEQARIAWMDTDRSAQSRELRKAFEATPYMLIARTTSDAREAAGWLDGGEVQAVVRVASGFGADIERGVQTEVQILVDGSNSNTASLIGNYASNIVGRYNREVLGEQMRQRLVARTVQGPARLGLPTVEAERRVWFNPELKSRFYFVPGIIVNIIMLVTLMLTALSIVREKEIGTMEQIMVTPIRPLELILGKTIPFAIVGIVDMALIVLIALTVFQVPLRGSVWMLFGASCLFLLTTLGAGLFLSTVSDTQQQAMMGAFFFFQPAFMLSGFTFPIRNMPEVVQWLTYLNPLRYFMDIVRGVFLKGVGLDVLWPQMLCLAGFGMAILLLSANRFHKRLD
jgi:ABC-2 type transport system permease protein